MPLESDRILFVGGSGGRLSINGPTLLNMKARTFERVDIAGNPPHALMGTAFAQVGPFAAVFGGYDKVTSHTST